MQMYIRLINIQPDVGKFILSPICRYLKFLLINRAVFSALTSAAFTDSGKVGGCSHFES